MNSGMLEKFDNLRFFEGVGMQEYMIAEEGLSSASANECSHYYIEGTKENLPSSWSDVRKRNYRRVLSTSSVTPIFHTSPKIPLCAEIDDIRKAAVDCVTDQLQLASSLNCKAIIIHGGTVYDNRQLPLSAGVALEAFVKSVTELEFIAENHDIELWIENLSKYETFPFKTICSSTNELLQVARNTKHAGFVYDTGHGNVNSGMPTTDLYKFFEEFGSRIRAVDFNDNDGKQDSHLPLGKGDISFSSLLETIAKTNWHGICIFETHHQTPFANLRYLSEVEYEV